MMKPAREMPKGVIEAGYKIRRVIAKKSLLA